LDRSDSSKERLTDSKVERGSTSLSHSCARVLLHVGLPKTGTTSLQRLLFSAHPEIRYFGQTNLWHDRDAKTVLRALLLGDVAETSAAKKILADAAQERPAIVISDEALTLGEFMLRATRWPVRSDHIATAHRARAVLGEAQVLIVLRNQADWLESWHRQGLKTGKYVETDYWAWLNRDLGVSAERLLALLDYDALYEAYRHVFGPQRVHVRLYEEYRDRFEDLAAECAGLISVDTNRARRLIRDGDKQNVTGGQFRGLPPIVKRLAAQSRVRCILDALPAGVHRRLRELLARERTYRRLSEADRAAIRGRFAASNARLMQVLELEDSPSGYQ
jgi:Sulfotransferase domain